MWPIVNRTTQATWLLLLALPAWLAGCPRQLRQPGRPAWLVAGSDNAYPPERYLFAAGSGPTRGEAEHAAAEKMQEKLQGLLARAAGSLVQYQVCGGLVDPRLDTRPLLELLPRPRIGPRWSSSDGTRHAAALVIDRQQALAGLRERVSLLAASASQNLDQARRHLRAGEIYPALRAALLALGGGVQALRISALAGVLAGSEPVTPASLAESSRLITTLLDSLEARTVRGHRQWLDERGRPREPLVAGVYFHRGQRTFPVSGLPVLFSPPEPAHPLPCVTNDVGLCSVELPAMTTAGRQELPVRFGLDAATITAFSAGSLPAGSAVFAGLRRRLGRALTSFSLAAAGKQAPRFMLLIEEYSSGRATGLHFSRALANEMRSRGFRPVEPGQLADDLAMSETIEEYAQVVRGRVEALISGRVNTHNPDRLSENFVLCRAGARLDVVDPSRPADARTVSDQVEAAGLDRRAACRRALAKLLERTTRAVLEAMAQIRGENRH